MAFDKTNAMRNAERYLAQGKIRSAITEYKSVIKHDSRDFVTMNMLGDLCAKENDTAQALKCYHSVAEHYAKQGFAAKAIAVYNKIARISPDSPEITERLAELHAQKGSISEAKEHYTKLADRHEKQGKKLESLAVWKKIATIDKTNTAVLEKLADAYIAEGEGEEAVEALNMLGERHSARSRFEDAASAFERALNIDERNLTALSGLYAASVETGTAGEVAGRLAGLIAGGEFDRDIARLLFDCYIAAEKAAEAEEVLLRLVELEPGNYELFLLLGKSYLGTADAAGAARALALSAEHLLVAGNCDGVAELANSLLELNPIQVEALRALSDIHTWQRDEPALLDSLKRLAEAARTAEAIHDERYALSQLTLIAPQETAFAARLRELNEEHGFEEEAPADDRFENLFSKSAAASDGPAVPKQFDPLTGAATFDYEELADAAAAEEETGPAPTYELETAGAYHSETPADTLDFPGPPADSGDGLAKEIESIRFYVDSGYSELAEKAADELRTEYGDRPEIAELFEYISSGGNAASDDTEEPAVFEGFPPAAFEAEEPVAEDLREEIEEVHTVEVPAGYDLSDLRTELGLEDEPDIDDSDYETHFNTAIAYKEMGLLDMAINEFQSAVSLVSSGDGTRRFFHCANLLGHCFMQMGMPHLSVTWHQRSLETAGLSDEEKQGIWYELASAYEADGDTANAARYFEMVFAENINFRDVAERLRTVAVTA